MSSGCTEIILNCILVKDNKGHNTCYRVMKKFLRPFDFKILLQFSVIRQSNHHHTDQQAINATLHILHNYVVGQYENNQS